MVLFLGAVEAMKAATGLVLTWVGSAAGFFWCGLFCRTWRISYPGDGD